MERAKNALAQRKLRKGVHPRGTTLFHGREAPASSGRAQNIAHRLPL